MAIRGRHHSAWSTTIGRRPAERDRSLSHPVAILLDPSTPRSRRKGTAIRTDNSSTAPPPDLDASELVELLEAHLADLNTHLALNTVALSAFGLASPALPAAEEEVCRCGAR